MTIAKATACLIGMLVVVKVFLLVAVSASIFVFLAMALIAVVSINKIINWFLRGPKDPT